MRLAAAGLVAAAIAAGVSAAVALHGQARHTVPQRGAARSGPAGVHGLMLFPLSDPDAHARNGAQSMESAP